ncbi:MAG TPA: hypothetical protein PLN63_09145, partial [Paludibacteraceae bacterium]|nr:hypothetical protein [Paludibacteraceae bacterium]HPH63764.1 hypothetical protein [Paludibacteraceae bacterium]
RGLDANLFLKPFCGMRISAASEGDFDRNEAGFLSGDRVFRRFFVEKYRKNLLFGSVFLFQNRDFGKGCIRILPKKVLSNQILPC